ncbi:MAG: tetratricopeptide repeat protein [Candidatus Babeliales bacterium]
MNYLSFFTSLLLIGSFSAHAVNYNSKQYAYHKPEPAEQLLTPPPAEPAPVREPAKDALIKKTIRDMTLDELRAAAEYAEKLSFKEILIKYLERIVILSTNPEELCEARFALAELYFEQKDMKKAGKLYKEYAAFYPGTTRCDEAERKEILCKFYQRNAPPCDMTKTRKTITLANRYLEHSPRIHRAHRTEIETVRITCFHELFEYDAYVVNHYVHKKSFNAARTRLTNARQELLSYCADIEPHLLELEGIIAQAEGNQQLVATTLQTLKERFPAFQPTRLVTQLNKKSYVGIF